MIRAPLSDGPADRLGLRLDRNRSLRADDLRDQQLGTRRKPCDTDAVVRLRGYQAGYERAVALCVDRGRPGDEALRRGDPAAQLGMGAVDPGVDHRNLHRGERRELRPGIERMVLHRVPLAREQRIVRDERLSAAAQPLHVTCSRHAAEHRRPRGRGCQCGDRGEIDDAGCAASSQQFRNRRGPCSRREADAEPGRSGGGRDAQRDREGDDRGRCSRSHAGTVIVTAGPAWPSAVNRYVAVASGWTVTANEPSTAGATLTDGSQTPLAPSFSSTGA